MTLFGKYRVAVGGRTHGTDPEESHRGLSSKTKMTVEPVFWHAKPLNLWQEVLQSYNVTAVIDAGASDGALALACCQRRLPYAGLCLTQPHKEHLTERIVSQIMHQMCLADSPLFEPGLASVMGKVPGSAQTTAKDPISNPNPDTQGGAEDVLKNFEAGRPKGKAL